MPRDRLRGGHVRLELRNVVAKYPFERSHRISGDPAEFRPQRLFAFELRRVGRPDELARRICHLAIEGERDPVRLHDRALVGLIPATIWRELS